MPHAVEPGSRLVQRYRLETHLAGPGPGPDAVTSPGASIAGGAVRLEQTGPTYWRAQDELLDRPVGICLLAADDEASERVLHAARKAAAVADPRFLRVLDASEVDGLVYVVSEWIAATDLVDLVEDGPLPPYEVQALGRDLAAALAAAHEAGLAHLCLQPEHVLRTPHGQLKLAGLAVDAAARGIAVDDPVEAARRDTYGAGAVLYAALTARWPADGESRLLDAPFDGAQVCRPRQVRAGVPDDLDRVICRALGIGTRHDGPPLRTPSALAEALTDVHSTARTPAVDAGRGGDDATQLTTAANVAPYVSPYDDPGPDRRRRRATGAAWGAIVTLLLVGLALTGWQLATSGFGGDETGEEKQASGSKASAGAPADDGIGRLDVADIADFDPQGDDGAEHPEQVRFAVDGDRSTAWTTVEYYDPLGVPGVKDGVGLRLDLGETVELAEVAVRVDGGLTEVEIRVAQSASDRIGDFELVDRPRSTDGRAVLKPDEPVEARYVVVWLTALPSIGGSTYQGAITEIELRG